MQFTYQLSEADYLRASGISTKPPRRGFARILQYLYPCLLLLIVWIALIAGMSLEWTEVHRQGISEFPILVLVSTSIIPALILFSLIVFAARPILRWSTRRARKEQFRNSPGCLAKTTAEFTNESVSFRSATGTSHSMWPCYSSWGERNGILVLATHGGVRTILKVSGLTEIERDELHNILTAALPRK